MLLKGEKRAAMAVELEIHVNTVNFHLVNLRRKVRANSVIELAVKVAQLNGALFPKHPV